MQRFIPAALLTLILLGLSAGPADAYLFGKNKVHYDSFDWHVYHSPHFDLYYYPEEELLASEAVETIDLGTVLQPDAEEPEVFLAMVGIGWDAIVVHYIDRMRHTRLGRIIYRTWADGIYILCGLLATLHIRPHRFRVHAEGALQPDAYRGAHFCNLRYYGKGMSMAPDAHHSSGLLHWQLRRASLLPALVWHLVAAQLRRKTPAFISDYGEANSASIESDRPVPIQIDGDFRGWVTGLHVAVLPRAARFRVSDKQG
jgi:diacylglycerol kinase family enzyme